MVITHQRCIFFSLSKGSCDFENGLCDMKHSNDAHFAWTIWSGETPTEYTGPLIGHSSLTTEGEELINQIKLFFVKDLSCFQVIQLNNLKWQKTC